MTESQAKGEAIAFQRNKVEFWVRPVGINGEPGALFRLRDEETYPEGKYPYESQCDEWGSLVIFGGKETVYYCGQILPSRMPPEVSGNDDHSPIPYIAEVDFERSRGGSLVPVKLNPVRFAECSFAEVHNMFVRLIRPKLGVSEANSANKALYALSKIQIDLRYAPFRTINAAENEIDEDGYNGFVASSDMLHEAREHIRKAQELLNQFLTR